MEFDAIVCNAGYVGTRMTPPEAALLRLLVLKLLRKERLSHIDDYNLDQTLDLFGGPYILPKKSFSTDFLYRTQRPHQQKQFGSYFKNVAPVLLPKVKSFSLDFHTNLYRGKTERYWKIITFLVADTRAQVCRHSSHTRSQNPRIFLRNRESGAR